MTDCLLCGNECKEQIYPNFFYCPNCKIATRSKESYLKDRIMEAYPDEWAEEHNQSVIANCKANYIKNYIKKLDEVHHILDVGCGSGLLVNKLSEAGYTADGLDYNKRAINFCKENMKGEFILGDESLDTITGEQKYDLIIVAHMLEHLENPSRLFKGIKRLLKPWGYVYMSMPNLEWYDAKSKYRRGILTFDPDHVVSYSGEGLFKLIKKYVEFGYYMLDYKTRTHRLEILTGLAIHAFNNVPNLSEGVHNNSRSLFYRVEKLPILPALMYVPNRLSERSGKGSELIMVIRRNVH